MKLILGLMLSVLTIAGVIDNIATVNRLKKEAAQAYNSGDYEIAIAHYHTLLDSLNVQDENIRMNLAHALLQAGDTISAQRNYSQLVKSSNTDLKSVAYQQMGVITSDQKEYKEALSFFKEALKANPANEEARYNYELVKQLLKEQEEQQNDQQNQDQQQDEEQQDKQDKQDQQQGDQQQNEQGEQSQDEQQGQKQQQESQQGDQKPQDADEQNAQQGEQQQEGEKSDEQQSSSPVSDRLKEMNISEEKARMILEAMRNSEMKYIQQNRRRPENPRDRTKPDW